MNEEQLSKRLEKVASYITKNERIADIGSDHAYLPCFAIKNGTASFAIAGEVVDGPFQSAQKQVRSSGLTEQIDVRKGNGLAVIEKEDAIDTIVIAGMGGTLIRTILEEGATKLNGGTKLILQPNIAAWQLREWSEQNNWSITSEAILREDNKIYEIIVLEPSEKPVTWTKQEIFLVRVYCKNKMLFLKANGDMKRILGKILFKPFLTTNQFHQKTKRKFVN